MHDHETDPSSDRSPQQIQATILQRDIVFTGDRARRRLELRQVLGQISQAYFVPVQLRTPATADPIV